MPKVSVIIPSYKDPLIHKTIDSLLDNAEGEIEVIAVLDGYEPDRPFRDDPRIITVHLGKNRGMRGAINAGVAIATGEFIMRTDEHCKFDKGYDVKLTETFEDNWIVTPMRYFLNPEVWEIIPDIKPFIYEKLAIRTENGKDIKFEGQRWPTRDRERKDIPIDETMSMQGSCWIMKKSWWDKVIQELETEKYGRHYQDSHEMVFKTWQAGGKLMLNKNTWFAHKHYTFSRTHNEAKDATATWDAALEIWKDYYIKEIRPKWGLC